MAKDVKGGTVGADGTFIVAFVLFLAGLLLALFQVHAVWGIPLEWFGGLFLVLGVVGKSPMMFLGALAFLAPSFIVQWLVGGALG